MSKGEVITFCVGCTVGKILGPWDIDGLNEGLLDCEGYTLTDGTLLGLSDGSLEGNKDGETEGLSDGEAVNDGVILGCVECTTEGELDTDGMDEISVPPPHLQHASFAV